LDQATSFVKEQGRMKYIRPIYQNMFKQGGSTRELAIKTFNEAKNKYHPIAAKMVGKDLHLG